MKNLLLTILLFTALFGYCQQEITGTIYDINNNPIKQVQITELGTKNTVYTDQSGTFRISVSNIDGDLDVIAKGYPPLRILQISHQQLEIIMMEGKGFYTAFRNHVALDSTSANYKTQIEYVPLDSANQFTSDGRQYRPKYEQYELEPPNTRLEVTQATYKIVSEKVLTSGCRGSRLIVVPDGKGGLTTKAAPVQLQYRTITKRVKVTPAKVKTINIPAKYGVRMIQPVQTTSE